MELNPLCLVPSLDIFTSDDVRKYNKKIKFVPVNKNQYPKHECSRNK